jgi:hypothetical protein
MDLPDYRPPNARRASMAAGLSPLLVLLSFTLTVTRLIEVDTAFAIGLASSVWVCHEMTVFQRSLDGYDRDYVTRHLAGRHREALRAFVAAGAGDVPTRDFVRGFLDRDSRPRFSDAG